MPRRQPAAAGILCRRNCTITNQLIQRCMHAAVTIIIPHWLNSSKHRVANEYVLSSAVSDQTKQRGKQQESGGWVWILPARFHTMQCACDRCYRCRPTLAAKKVRTRVRTYVRTYVGTVLASTSTLELYVHTGTYVLLTTNCTTARSFVRTC